MDWPVVALVLGLLAAAYAFLATGATLRGAAAEQAEQRHAAERQLDAARIEGLDAQLRDAREQLAAAERLDAARVAEAARLRLALGAADAGGPAADGLLLDLGPAAGPAAAPGAPDAAGGLPA